jgi:hypothetical protein
MRGNSNAALSQRTTHAPGRFATIQEPIVGEATGVVVLPGRSERSRASRQGARKVISCTKPTPTPKRSCRFACIKPTGGFCKPLKMH